MSRTRRRLRLRRRGPSANMYHARFRPCDLHDPDMQEFIHHEIYRNGSAYRQRRNAIRIMKRYNHRQERQRLKELLLHDWQDY